MSGLQFPANVGVQDMTPKPNDGYVPDPIPGDVVQAPSVDSPTPGPSRYYGLRPDSRTLQRISYNVPTLEEMPPTEEELRAVGYVPTLEEMPPTQEELDAVGYKDPLQKTPEEVKEDNIKTRGGELLDFLTAAGMEVGSIAGGAVKNIGKLTGSQTLENLGEVNKVYADRDVAEARKRSPVAGALGKYLVDTTSVLASTPSATTTAGIAAAGALGGALTSLAISDSSNPLNSILQSAAIGGAGGAVLHGLGTAAKTAISRIFKGGQALVSNSDDLVNNTMQSAVNSNSAKDITKVTPAAFVKSMEDVTESSKTVVNNLYKARDDFAEQLGAKVERSGLNSFLETTKAAALKGKTEETSIILSKAKDLIGNNAPLTFKEARDHVSDLGKEAFSAGRTGDLVKQNALLKLKDLLEKDIQQSVNSDELASLHGAANKYFADVYSPLKDLKLDRKMADKYTQDLFVGKLANTVLDSPKAMAAANSVNPTIRDEAVAASLNAIKSASNDKDGILDLTKFSNNLRQEVMNNRGAYGESFDHLVAMADVLKAHKIASTNLHQSQVMKGLQLSAGIGGYLVGGPAGLATMVGMEKAAFLYMAGKMIDNPNAQSLLRAVTSLQKSGRNPTMLSKVTDKAAEALAGAFKNLPNRFHQSISANVGGYLGSLED